MIFKRARDEKIINPPANVIFAGFPPMRPPSIAFCLGIKEAESVEEVCVEKIRDSATFFVGKAGGMMVSFWASEVDFFMRAVKVAAGNDRFFFFK